MKILEACVDSLPQALQAQARGAHRIELCSRLDLDGLSPDHETIRAALTLLKIPTKVMIRPRPGTFIYSEEDLLEMEREILFCKETGVKEVVLGACLPSGELDIPPIRRLAELAAPMAITIHKAIDESPDPLADIEKLRPISNITHMLSSGKQATALAGAALLREMIRAAGDRFTIIVAGKVTKENLQEVYAATGAKEYHGKRIVGELS
ncbi:MAG: copper homeostasis protein CutC [Saprospirales bacterium]|nr:copper homeostasis protein CutC [Saprospirales bacterium]